MIELYGVSKKYPGGQVGLRDVNLQIPKGQLVFLTGASGAGKTTFLKLIYREETPSEGYILVNGRNVSSLPENKVPYLRRTIGVVFQNFRLIPRKTVFENVCYLPRILGLDAKAQKKQAFETLRRVGLAHRMNAFPLQLSGGEQQRVAVARALINQPEILLADEPTGNLDPEMSEEILKLFLEINLQGTTVIFASHDRELIQRVGRRVLTLDAGQLKDDRELPSLWTPDTPPFSGTASQLAKGSNDSSQTDSTVADATVGTKADTSVDVSAKTGQNDIGSGTTVPDGAMPEGLEPTANDSGSAQPEVETDR